MEMLSRSAEQENSFSQYGLGEMYAIRIWRREGLIKRQSNGISSQQNKETPLDNII